MSKGYRKRKKKRKRKKLRKNKKKIEGNNLWLNEKRRMKDKRKNIFLPEYLSWAVILVSFEFLN